MADATTALINNLQSDDDATRQAAEASLEAAIASSPASAVRSLLEAMASHPDPAARMASSVFLRKPLDAWPKLDGETQQLVLRVFAERVVSEPEDVVRRRVANACMHVARVAETWPGVVEGAISAVAGASPGAKESLLTLVARVAEARPEWVQPHAAAIAAVAGPALGSGEAPAVRAAAADAICNVASRLEAADATAAFASALPAIVSTAREIAAAGSDDAARRILADLTVAMSGSNKRALVKDVAVAVVGGAETIASTDSLSVEVRTEAIQVIIHACQLAGPQVRAASLHSSLITLFLRLMARVPEEGIMAPAAFGALPYDPERLGAAARDLAPLADVAEDALDRIASCFGPSLALPVGMAAAGSLLAASQPWSVRRAAVVAVGVLVVACGRPSAAKGGAGAGAAHAAKGRGQGGLAREQRAAVLGMLVRALAADADQRVRYEAARALARYAACLCDSLVPTARSACREMCMPAGALTALAAAAAPTSGNVPCVCAAAAAAIQAVLTPACPAEAVTERLGELMAALQPLLGTPVPTVTAQALHTIAAVASAVGEGFSVFYAPLIGPIRSIASSATVIGAGEDANTVRAAAMVCLGSMVESVPPETFAADAAATLGPLFDAITQACAVPAAASASGPAAPSDGGVGAMRLGHAAIGAVGKIGAHLGPAFAPFMGHIMPPLLAAASVDIGFSASEVNDTPGGSGRTSRGPGAASSVVVAFSGMGNIEFRVNTDAVTEKQEALGALFDLVHACGPAIGPYAPRVVEVLVAQSTERFNSTCRALAAPAIAPCIKAAIEYAVSSGRSEAEAVRDAAPMLGAALAAVAEQASKEATTDAAPVQMTEALRDLVMVALVGQHDEAHLFTKGMAPALPLSGPTLSAVVFGSSAAAAMAAERIRVKTEDIAAQGASDAQAVVEMREDLEDEETVLRQSIDALGYAIKNAGPAVLGDFETHSSPVLAPFLADGGNLVLHHAALCSFVDVCEWCGEGAGRYVGPLMGALGRGMLGADEDVRQVSCYGVGAMAESQPAAIASHAAAAVTALRSVIARADARSSDNEFATDNAVSALGKILRHCGAAVGGEGPALWKLWVQSLPIRSDETEAFYCHGMLAEQAEAGNPVIVGEGGSNVPEIVRVFGEVFASAAGGGGAAAPAAGADGDEDEDDEDVPISMASAGTVHRMVAVLKGFNSKLPAGTLGSIARGLPEHVRAALGMAMA